MQKNPIELPCLALTRNIPSSLVTVSAFQSVADLVRYMDEEVIPHRNDIPSTFLHVYESPTVLTKQLIVSFIGEDGLDLGGLTKEFLTMTWAEVFGPTSPVRIMQFHICPYIDQEQMRRSLFKLVVFFATLLPCCIWCLHGYVAAPCSKLPLERMRYLMRYSCQTSCCTCVKMTGHC